MPEPPTQKGSAEVHAEERALAPGAPSPAALRHELRQPLNHIIGYSELLLEEAKARELEPFTADLEKIQEAARTLSNLLDSVVPASESAFPVGHRAEGQPRPGTEAAGLSVPGVGRTNAAAASGHVLVVDDDLPSGDFLSRQLRQQGYRVSIATDGRRALESIMADPADVVLLDVLMPEMDGFATCAALKADPDTRDIPVIFMTALSDTVDKLRGFELGAVDYITKPFHREEVLARIATHLTLRRLLRSVQESEARLSGIIESAMDAIVTLGGEGDVLLFNRAAERVFRCEAGEAIGRPVRPFLSEGLDRALAGYIAGPAPKPSGAAAERFRPARRDPRGGRAHTHPQGPRGLRLARERQRRRRRTPRPQTLHPGVPHQKTRHHPPRLSNPSFLGPFPKNREQNAGSRLAPAAASAVNPHRDSHLGLLPRCFGAWHAMCPSPIGDA